jgi:hypothetical protein
MNGCTKAPVVGAVEGGAPMVEPVVELMAEPRPERRRRREKEQR